MEIPPGEPKTPYGLTPDAAPMKLETLLGFFFVFFLNQCIFNIFLKGFLRNNFQDAAKKGVGTKMSSLMLFAFEFVISEGFLTCGGLRLELFKG